eukprot:4504329-Pleurochrysis_carterae.AAC.1
MTTTSAPRLCSSDASVDRAELSPANAMSTRAARAAPPSPLPSFAGGGSSPPADPRSRQPPSPSCLPSPSPSVLSAPW